MAGRINGAITIVTLIAALTAACSAAISQSAPENPDYLAARGPIPIRDMMPFNLLFLQFTPETGDVLPVHGSRFRLQLDVDSNLLAPNAGSGATILEDNEYQRLQVAYRLGIGHETELGVYSSLVWRDGGFLDPIIRAYHALVGLDANGPDDPPGRDAHPMYQSVIRLVDSNGNLLLNQGNGFGLGETSVTVKHSILKTTRRGSLSVRLGVKLPTGNPVLLLGSGSADAGISLDARYSVGRDIILYGNLGGVLMGSATRVPGAQPSMVQGMAGIEYRPNNRDSFIVQVDGNSLAVNTGNAFADRLASTATFGYKRVMNWNITFFASFSENGKIHNYLLPYFSDIGPDFTVSTGFELRH